jgi:hypothetical protein
MSCGKCFAAAGSQVGGGVPADMAIGPAGGGGDGPAQPLGPPPPQTPYTHPMHTAMHRALSEAASQRGWTAGDVVSARYLEEVEGDGVYGQVLVQDGDRHYGVTVRGSTSRGTLDEPEVEKLADDDAVDSFYGDPDAFVGTGEYTDLAAALEYDLEQAGSPLPPEVPAR